ncbi:MAG: hypothetical protein Terrestrivirus9_27 [Terrestrivirus sp.]|uniref:Uncharacterized protein n=1 Tax=Terrestrivirus sp. TaxID=2487775 RepID=A0A3G4ZNW4_9VIRU|nr:MAG: hypothetical protein Terrestrivirus9_27 [Terrestrivirus sp.]
MENNILKNEIDENAIFRKHFDYHLKECYYLPKESEISIKNTYKKTSNTSDKFIEGQLVKTKSSSDPGKLNKIGWYQNKMRKFRSDKDIKKSSTIELEVRLYNVLYNRDDLNSFVRFCESISKTTLYMIYFYIETVYANQLIIKTHIDFDTVERIIRRYISPELIELSSEEIEDMKSKFYNMECTVFDRVLKRIGFHLEIIFSKWLCD